MKELKFVSEGSRGESEITFGGVKELNELVSRYVGSRELLLLEEDGDVLPPLSPPIVRQN